MEEEGTDGGQDQDGTPDYDRQIKAGLAVGRMCLIQQWNSCHAREWPLALTATLPVIPMPEPTAVPALPLCTPSLATRFPNGPLMS
jgi:hypothetical protein